WEPIEPREARHVERFGHRLVETTLVVEEVLQEVAAGRFGRGRSVFVVADVADVIVVGDRTDSVAEVAEGAVALAGPEAHRSSVVPADVRPVVATHDAGLA